MNGMGEFNGTFCPFELVCKIANVIIGTFHRNDEKLSRRLIT